MRGFFKPFLEAEVSIVQLPSLRMKCIVFRVLILFFALDQPAKMLLFFFFLAVMAPLGSAEDVGVFYMPSWSLLDETKPWKDSFWTCLQGRDGCTSLSPGGEWGPEGRKYSTSDPYRGPFADRKPHADLGGFYLPDSPSAHKKQLQIMKANGITFFAYDWFFNRHYYHHVNFEPQKHFYYPAGWPKDDSRAGRVAVPGLTQWTVQLETLLKENAKLPASEQMKWAVNWCEDGAGTWEDFLRIGTPEEIALGRNFPGEKPSRELFLKIHEKMTRLWTDVYFSRPDYLRAPDGRPVVYWYFPQDVQSRASYYNIKLADLVQLSVRIAKEQRFPGIKFIAVNAGPTSSAFSEYGLPTTWAPKNAAAPWNGGVYAGKKLLDRYVREDIIPAGFEGQTTYVYHDFQLQENLKYTDMQDTYKKHWDLWTSSPYRSLEYQVPVAMGWDRQPAGGTWPQASGVPSHPKRDFGRATKAEFKQSLANAVAKSRTQRAGGTVMVCCWNEYTEGNHIEPSVGMGYSYVEAIKEVFLQSATASGTTKATTKTAATTAPKKQKCFGASSTVLVKRVGQVRLDRLEIGQLVQSYDPHSGKLSFSPVIGIVHENEQDRVETLELTLLRSDGTTSELIATNTHLLVVPTKEIFRQTSALAVGDLVVMADGSHAAVKKVQSALHRVRNPLTMSGLVVVDGVAASCHSVNHNQFQRVVAPLRFLYSLSPSLVKSRFVQRAIFYFDKYITPHLEKE